MRQLWVVVVATLGLLVASRADAQCGDRWFAGPLQAPRGAAFAAIPFDLDGAGPLPTQLVVGGIFYRAGGPGAEGALANCIAAFDGTNWNQVGQGLEPVDLLFFFNGGVNSLGLYGSNLYAGGSFTIPGFSGNNVARWDGVNWVPTTTSSFNGPVRAMIVYNGELIVGGTFTKIGGLTVNGIAAYNGTTWRALGSGVVNGSFDTGVLALATYGGELIAAGEFDTAGGVSAMSIARWNGSTWTSLGTGLAQNGNVSTIRALSTYAGELVAGGNFNNAGGLAVSDVARWNGTSWQAMDVGLDGPVTCFGFYGGELIAGGSFLNEVSGAEIDGVARWNGSRWAPLAASPPDIFGAVYCLPTWNGLLYPGGSFQTAGSASVDGIAAWNGSAWLDVPGLIYDDTLSPNVRSLAVWNGELIMGGFFRAADDFSFSGRHIVEWSGLYTRDLPVNPDGAVLAMLPIARGANIPDDLIVAGSFTDMYFGSDAHNRVALLTSVADTNGRITRTLGAGFNNTVWSLARFNGSTIAAGDFTASGATSINRLARFDGTNWVPFDAIGANGSVRVLKSYNGTAGRIHLLVGGSFTSVAGITANRIAQYTFNTLTPGASWSGLDPGFNGRVDAVERFGGVTFAAGQFTATSTGTPLNRIARFVSGTWQQVGSGFNGNVSSLFADGPYLYAGGSFTASGATPMAGFARWDGTSWTAVDTGANGNVGVIGKYQSEIIAGGAFTRVGAGAAGGPRFGAIESELVARLPITGAPWIALEGQPQSGQVCRGGTWFTLTSVARGYETNPIPTYTWQRNGVPVVAGPTPHGSTIEFAGTYIIVRNAQPEDAGAYTCIVDNTCGSVTSLAATLKVCAADFNCDGVVDDLDFQIFTVAYDALVIPPANPACDINDDNLVDDNDFQSFVVAYNELYCP